MYTISYIVILSVATYDSNLQPCRMDGGGIVEHFINRFILTVDNDYNLIYYTSNLHSVPCILTFFIIIQL